MMTLLDAAQKHTFQTIDNKTNLQWLSYNGWGSPGGKHCVSASFYPVRFNIMVCGSDIHQLPVEIVMVQCRLYSVVRHFWMPLLLKSLGAMSQRETCSLTESR